MSADLMFRIECLTLASLYLLAREKTNQISGPLVDTEFKQMAAATGITITPGHEAVYTHMTQGTFLQGTLLGIPVQLTQKLRERDFPPR